MLQDSMNSWKASSASWLWKHSGSQLASNQVNMAVEAKLCTQFIQLLQRWLCNLWSGVVMENWALSVDQCRLEVLQFSVHLINLLSKLLRYNGFTRIQKAVMDQTSNNDHDFFWCQFGFGKCFRASSQSIC